MRTTGRRVELRTPIVVLTGAGVSTDSGIPDYRSPNGLWHAMDPQEFHIEKLHADPDRFWGLRAQAIERTGILNAKPNVAHRLLANAVLGRKVEHILTQNIDGLHGAAGTPANRLLELHGNSHRCRCDDCGATTTTIDALARRTANGGRAPRCDAAGCNGILRPDVVLFGEPVPLVDDALSRLDGCGTLIAAGTSLLVHPVAGLAGHAVHAGADLVVCNNERTPYDELAARVERGPVAQSLGALLG